MLSRSKHLRIWTAVAAQTGEALCKPAVLSAMNHYRKMLSVSRIIAINCCFGIPSIRRCISRESVVSGPFESAFITGRLQWSAMRVWSGFGSDRMLCTIG